MLTFTKGQARTRAASFSSGPSPMTQNHADPSLSCLRSRIHRKHCNFPTSLYLKTAPSSSVRLWSFSLIAHKVVTRAGNHTSCFNHASFFLSCLISSWVVTHWLVQGVWAHCLSGNKDWAWRANISQDFEWGSRMWPSNCTNRKELRLAQ